MVPNINTEYEKYGSNTKGLIVLAAHKSGTDANIQTFDNTNKVKYPSISGNSGGTTIFSTYQVNTTPTLILIAPDKKIVEKDIWPIANLPTILAKYNFTPITNNLNEKVVNEIAVKNVNAQKIGFSIPIDGNYKISLYTVEGKKVMDLVDGFVAKGEHAVSMNTHELSSGIYLVKMRFGDVNKSQKIMINK